jgi:ABC-2 type transport system permease protein
MILGVCAVMLVFNNSDLKRRNLCSPVKIRNINMQLVLGNLSFALLTWFIMIVTSIIIYNKYMFTLNGLLFLLNSFIFTTAALSISFLLANLIKSRGAMSAVANVVSLGSSFIGGGFVPQELMGKTVLNIASFTPTYWYIKANNIIADTVDYNMEALMPVFYSMLIVFAFAAATLAVTLVVIKQKRLNA